MTRTLDIKLDLTELAPAKRLDATVTGPNQSDLRQIIEIPARVPKNRKLQPTVRVVGRPVSLGNFHLPWQDQPMVSISGGLNTRELTNATGLQLFHPIRRSTP
jgi:hypothetical protein